MADDRTDVVTLHEAAEALKVHYMTAYRWVRQGDLAAFKAGGRLRVRRTDLEHFMETRTVDVAAPAQQRTGTDWPLHVERLHAALAEGARADATAMVRKVIADGASAADVYVNLITPAMHRIGDDWQAGRLNVAEEHRATQIVAGVLGRLGDHFRRRGANRGRVITCTPAGELHGLATVMVGDFLRGAGYEVHQLGPDVPLADLALMVQLVEPSAICVSVTQDDIPDDALQGIVHAVRELDGARVVVGGQGCTGDRAMDLDAQHVGDIRGLAEALGERP